MRPLPRSGYSSSPSSDAISSGKPASSQANSHDVRLASGLEDTRSTAAAKRGFGAAGGICGGGGGRGSGGGSGGGFGEGSSSEGTSSIGKPSISHPNDFASRSFRCDPATMSRAAAAASLSGLGGGGGGGGGGDGDGGGRGDGGGGTAPGESGGEGGAEGGGGSDGGTGGVAGEGGVGGEGAGGRITVKLTFDGSTSSSCPPYVALKRVAMCAVMLSMMAAAASGPPGAWVTSW